MKNCSNCGKGNEDGAKFCVDCGSKFGENLLIEQKDASDQNEKPKENRIISWLKSLSMVNIAKNAKSAVVVAICLTFGFYAMSTTAAIGGGVMSIIHCLQGGLGKREINLVNVIIKEKRGIQELAAAKGDYTIEKNITETQGIVLFDYVTRKFICDFHYTAKYGYDLSSLNNSDITVNKADKVVEINLPKGRLIANELTKTNIRHNEGIIGSWNTVKAEDIDALQMEAKAEVAKRAESDEQLKKLAKDNIKLAFEKTIHSVAPDYSVVFICG